MDNDKVPSELVFILSVAIAFFYGLLALTIGGLGKYGEAGGDGTAFGYLGTCFFLSLMTFALSFIPFASDKGTRWGWWVVGGWAVVSLIVLYILVLRGFFYNPGGIG